MRWEIKSIGELCEIFDNKRKPITKRDRIEGEIPYYGATGVLSYIDDFIFNEKLVLLGEDGAKWESGDNSSFIINGKTWVNNHAHVLKPKRNFLLDEWLVYNLNHQNLMPYVSGMTVPKLNQGNMKKIEIPIPPLSEQKQIVETLDKAFEKIDKAIANIERNIKNAGELLNTKIEELFDSSTEMKPISKICLKTNNISWKAEGKKEYKYLDLSSVKRNDNKIISYSVVNCDNAPSRAKKFIIERDVIFATTRPTLKRAAIIDKTFNNNICSTGFVVLRSKGDVKPDWIYNFLFTKKFISRMEKLQRGASYPAVSDNDVKNTMIPLPINSSKELLSLEELNKVKGRVKNLKHDYNNKINSLNELKKSILEKAFNGELTSAA